MKNLVARKRLAHILLLSASVALASCASLGASGPSSSSIRNADVAASNIMVVNLTDSVARDIVSYNQIASFAKTFGSGYAAEQIVGAGDIVDIAIWEAPPAALFGTASVENRLAPNTAVARSANIPEQMVDGAGQISVPFVGVVKAVGRSPRDIAREITTRLAGKANAPQVMVRIAQNQAANVTVVGEVNQSRRVPLSTKGERLLDVLASAGGVKQPINKVTIQVARDGMVVAKPLATVIADPAENIVLRSNDVVTALYRPYSFQALGAFGTNAEVEFEATGLTLAGALGRIGGLQDNRADVKGVFIFRLEEPAALGARFSPNTRTTPDGKVPVIYRVNMADPATFFIAQGFPMKDHDVLYVSNAPLVDIQKFVGVISSMAFSVVSIGNAVN